VEKYSRAVQVTDDNIVRHMYCACWITKDTDTHFKYVMLIAFTGNIGYANATQRYVYTHISSLVLFNFFLLLSVINNL